MKTSEIRTTINELIMGVQEKIDKALKKTKSSGSSEIGLSPAAPWPFPTGDINAVSTGNGKPVPIAALTRAKLNLEAALNNLKDCA